MPDRLRQLQEDVARAREAFTNAAHAFDTLVDRMPRDGYSSQGRLQIEHASRTFKAALEEYSRAVNRLHEFVTRGKLTGAGD